MATAQETLEDKAIKQVNDNTQRAQITTRYILENMGGSDEIMKFYGIKYNATMRCCHDNKGRMMLNGGTEQDYLNNISIYQKINSAVLAYLSQGSSSFDKYPVPNLIREAIINRLGV